MFGSTPVDGALRRWPRGQKFTLSQAGLGADALHREAVSGVRGSGRAALEAALLAWAGPFGVQPGDGLLLSELRQQRRGLNELALALDAAGIAPAEVKAGVDRLVRAGLVDPAERGPGVD